MVLINNVKLSHCKGGRNFAKELREAISNIETDIVLSKQDLYFQFKTAVFVTESVYTAVFKTEIKVNIYIHRIILLSVLIIST